MEKRQLKGLEAFLISDMGQTDYFLHGQKHPFILAFSIKDNGERIEFRQDLERYKNNNNGKTRGSQAED